MRNRLSKTDRRTMILDAAAALFAAKGVDGTEMEDIRQACGISRGGLYHHFANRRDVLDGLVDREISALARVLDDESQSPLPAILRAGSGHLGAETGLLSALRTGADRQDYLAAVDTALIRHVAPRLALRLRGQVRDGVDPEHVAELFLTVNAHINRRQILGHWDNRAAAAFAGTALRALAPLLADPDQLTPMISTLAGKDAP
ncbi:TetR/AcrR family transcriptional regulator [Marivivens marinus]|uniref:TetR/AcrR family transcriptional regulator n=1 Tax=Marivivens marinus TaxID=3110173 RepID=UPI003B84B3A1